MEQRRAEEEATGKKKRGRKPKVVEPLPTEEAKANTTDPDSRIMKTRSLSEDSFLETKTAT